MILISGSSFGTAINCIDGRAQEPVIKWVKKNHSVDFVDLITIEGPDRVVSEEVPNRIYILKKKIIVSIDAHNSKTLVIAGHYDCAGNPVSKEEHFEQIKKSAELIRSWNFPIKVIGLWVNDKWEVEVLEQ